MKTAQNLCHLTIFTCSRASNLGNLPFLNFAEHDQYTLFNLLNPVYFHFLFVYFFHISSPELRAQVLVLLTNNYNLYEAIFN